MDTARSPLWQNGFLYDFPAFENKRNILYFSLLIPGAVSTVVLMALHATGIFVSEIASYALIATSLITIISGVAAMAEFLNTRKSGDIEDRKEAIWYTAVMPGSLLLTDVLFGMPILFLNDEPMSCDVCSLSSLETAGLTILPYLAIGSIACILIANNKQQAQTGIIVALPSLISGALAMFISTQVPDIITGNYTVDLLASPLPSLAIFIISEIILHWFCSTICRYIEERSADPIR